MGLPADAIADGLAGAVLRRGDDIEAPASLSARDAVARTPSIRTARGHLHGGADRRRARRAAAPRRVRVQRRAEHHRVLAFDLGSLVGHYEGIGALVVFPPFGADDILSLVRRGGALPSGISRHVIPGRALRVNYSMADLADEAPREDKNRHRTSGSAWPPGEPDPFVRGGDGAL
ncbi:MAG: hypothetical protein U0470_08815 [Anaerolineae bacterium]